MTIKPKYRRGDILNNVTVDETEDDSGNDSDSEANLNSKSEVNPNTDNVGKCNATDAHTGIHFEEGSTSFIRHGVNDKLKDITLAEISSSYVRDTCDSEVKSTNPNCQTTFPYNIVNVDTTHGPINTPSKTKLKAHNNRTSLSRSPKCNNISRRSSSVPVNTSKVKLDGNPRKKRFKSLRLINPIFGVRGWHQSRKSQGKPKKCPIITSQPIPDSSERFCDSVTLSDSFSNIQRCNLRILSEPPMVTGSVSHEVDNTILIGNQIGFNMNGVPEDHKKSWIKRLCSEHKVNFLGIQETMTGGILAVWDTSCFSLIDSLEGNDYREKKKLWKELSQVITFHNTFTILLGDFNEVRSQSERMGTIFDPRGAAKFNDFITIADLCDLPMGGKWFTQMNNLGSKLSKIDRNLTVDYGPTPFKLYNSWIDHTGFLLLVQNSWSSAVNGPPLVNIRDTVDGIDNKAESHPLNSEEIDDRIQWVKLLASFEHQKVKDLRQKAKLKWALEGDENSQFFHGIINNRRNRARINGLNIQEAVWDCGSSKSLGPDGFTFTFFKKHWDIVEHDVISYVKDFEVSAHIPKGCNSSFITLVPKLEIEEVDSVFLDSAYASVLVNGSPTKEFKVERGLSQGDPLSPFLFILAIKALNVSILKATNRDLFHGVKVGKDKFHISHIHFADDALIMGEWSLMNALNLSRILTCFHLASGIKVNFSKSKHFGIRVSNVELYSIASSIGCLASHFPCIYLGLPIGANMLRCNNWKPLVDKFQKRLSK
ncbi:RNA-directed DNA polymerase, eukaryota [Tanacetum coccineum]